jgi:uncharacterized protein involved in cysteine biosynthesis
LDARKASAQSQKVKRADRALSLSSVFINLLARTLTLDWPTNMPDLANLLQMLLWIGAVIAVFNVIIFVHELGHFLAAKWRGLKIERPCEGKRVRGGGRR